MEAGTQAVARMAKAHNGKAEAYDELQAELLANPETVHVTIGGASVPFLLSVDGCERAAAKGHDPLPALGGLIAAVFERVGGAGRLAGVDPGDEAAVAEAMAEAVAPETLRAVLTTPMLSDLVVVLYAGVVSFDRGLRFETFKARVTLGTVFAVVTRVLPKILAFAKDIGGAEPGAADAGDAGN